jgi:hypothetical protein
MFRKVEQSILFKIPRYADLSPDLSKSFLTLLPGRDTELDFSFQSGAHRLFSKSYYADGDAAEFSHS